MNDRYLFRGKTTYDKWVDGDLITFGGRCYIHPQNSDFEVKSGLARIVRVYKAVSKLDLYSHIISNLEKENAKQKAILEAIDNEMMPLPFETDFDKAIKTAKSEAIKEFAERLKKVKDDLKYYLDNNEENGVVYIPKFVINNLVKEMTEAEE